MNQKSRQQGAILIIVFFILFVVTLIIFTTSKTSIVRERIAINEQNMNETLQLANSAVEEIFASIYVGDNIDLLTEVMISSSGISDPTSHNNLQAADGQIDTESQVQYLGSVTIGITGQSINSDENSHQLGNEYFEITGTATRRNNSAQTSVHQGILYK